AAALRAEGRKAIEAQAGDADGQQGKQQAELELKVFLQVKRIDLLVEKLALQRLAAAQRVPACVDVRQGLRHLAGLQTQRKDGGVGGERRKIDDGVRG